MPAPPTSKQQESIKSPANTRTTSTKDQSRISPSSPSPGGGGQPGNSRVSSDNSSHTSSVTKNSNVTTLNKTAGGPSILQQAQQRMQVAGQQRSAIPTTPKQFPNDRLAGYTGVTPPTPNYNPARAAPKQFQNDRLAGYTGMTPPTPGYNSAHAQPSGIPTNVGPSYARGGSKGLAPVNSNAPLTAIPASGVETRPYKPSYGGFSLEGAMAKVKDFGRRVGEGMQKINEIGAETVLANTRQRPPREPSGNDPETIFKKPKKFIPGRRRKPARRSWARADVGYARGGAVEKFMQKYPGFKLT